MSVLKTSLSPNGPYMMTLNEDKSNQKEYEAALAKYSQQMKEISGMEVTYTGWQQELSILGFIKIQLDAGLMNFSWFLIMICWLALTRFLVFWAVKQTDIGKQIGWTLQNLGERTLGAMPIIPVGEHGMGWNVAKQLPDELGKKINSVMKVDDQNRALNALFNPNSEDAKKLEEERRRAAEKDANEIQAKQYFWSSDINPVTYFARDGNKTNVENHRVNMNRVADFAAYATKERLTDPRTQQRVAQGYEQVFDQIAQDQKLQVDAEGNKSDKEQVKYINTLLAASKNDSQSGHQAILAKAEALIKADRSREKQYKISDGQLVERSATEVRAIEQRHNQEDAKAYLDLNILRDPKAYFQSSDHQKNIEKINDFMIYSKQQTYDNEDDKEAIEKRLVAGYEGVWDQIYRDASLYTEPDKKVNLFNTLLGSAKIGYTKGYDALEIQAKRLIQYDSQFKNKYKFADGQIVKKTS